MMKVMVITAMCLCAGVGYGDVLTWTQDTSAPSMVTGQYLMNAKVIAGETYLVGFDTTASNAGKVWRQTGGAWVEVGTPGVSWLDDVTGTSATNLWASGNGRLTHWDGVSWTSVPITGEGRSIEQIDVQNILSGTTVGKRLLTSDGGANWVSESTSLGAVYATAATSTTDMWIGGCGGIDSWTPIIEHYDGSSWNSYSLPYGWKVWDIDIVGADVYVCGYHAQVFKYNSGTDSFDDMSLIPGWQSLVARGIAADSSGTPYVVLDRGGILSYDTDPGAPGEWELQMYLSSAAKDFQGIAFNGDVIYAVGEDGVWNATVPEPVSLVLLGLGGLHLGRRRR